MKRKTGAKPGILLVDAADVSDASDNGDTYAEKVRDLTQQLKMLSEKIHPEYLKAKRKLDNWLAEEKQRVHILHEHKLETISREYIKEAEACERDCDLEKRRIQDYLVSLCEELKRRLEHDKKNIELTPSGDILDYKPAVTRKLRRRAGSDISTSTSSNFVYWGDLLLCGSPWPVNIGGSKSSQFDGTTSNELLSPIPNSGNETTQEAAPTNNDSESADASKTNRCSPNATTETTSSVKIKSNSVKSNLFGSLGINLFDGSLLSHLLASINHLGLCNSVSLGLQGSSGGTFSANPYNLMCIGPPSGPATASVPTGLMMPSSFVNIHPTNSLAAALNSVAGNLVCQPTAKKRRQQNSTPVAQLNLLLPENDIYADLTVIHRACAKAASSSSTGLTGVTVGGNRKQSQHAPFIGGSSTVSADSPPHSGQHLEHGYPGINPGQTKNSRESVTPVLHSPVSAGCLGSPNPHAADQAITGRTSTGLVGSSAPGSTGLSVWIDDGRLYCGQKCFQNGALVMLEGRDGSSHRCTGTIAAIGAQDVVIRRSSDHGVCRVTVQQLKQGRYALWPAKSS